MPDVMYLRKSRSDTEIENATSEDVLARHESELRRNAARLGRTITQVYREVVSGDTIASRPLMRQLLLEVESGMWEAVHVVEVSRLARGDTVDQGIVARSFANSGTLIITPSKTIDPNDEYDSDYFEFDLFMSRREYKAITRRQQRGRDASVREGKWPGNKPPYGYDRIKIPGEKGWTIEPNAEADVVRWIFDWYLNGCDGHSVGASLIARKLNADHIPPPGGREWTTSAVTILLRRPAYAGWTYWKRRNARKRPGETAPRLAKQEYLICPGIHTPLVTQEIFDAVQERLKRNPSRPGPTQVAMTNPLSGLVICSLCGRRMTRRPYSSGRKPSLICAYSECPTVGSDLDVVEDGILESLRVWLAQYEAGRPTDTGLELSEISRSEARLRSLDEESRSLEKQLTRVYELTEKGIYSTDDFLSRSRSISSKRDENRAAVEATTAELSRQRELYDARSLIAPRIRRVLDAYPLASSPEEKNALLKSVLEKVVYAKSSRASWKTGSDLSIHIYPLLPAPH